MPINFRKIFAKDYLFVKLKETHKIDHAYFQSYAESLTVLSGKSTNNQSGKGRSYADYLIRLVIFYQEFFNKEVENLLTFATLKEIERVIISENFKKYNDDEGRFPNAAFNCYLSCVTHINAEIEEKVDLQLNESLEAIISDESDIKISNIIRSAEKRKERTKSGNVSTYPRKVEESLEAKRRSNWQCDLDSNHVTFISNASRKPFMEAHHLIPMSAQDYFEYTLDFADNIVCLCPNCHRKIHHAKDKEKKEILEFLFNNRKRKYSNYGIEINFKKVITFYGII